LLFFKNYDKLEKDYIFINTKDILSNILNKGDIDIYYADDTHWGYKANNTIAKYISKHHLKKETIK